MHAVTALAGTLLPMLLLQRGQLEAGILRHILAVSAINALYTVPTYLLLVRGDPTRRVSDTLAIERVWKNGYPVRPRVGSGTRQ